MSRSMRWQCFLLICSVVNSAVCEMQTTADNEPCSWHVLRIMYSTDSKVQHSQNEITECVTMIAHFSLDFYKFWFTTFVTRLSWQWPHTACTTHTWPAIGMCVGKPRHWLQLEAQIVRWSSKVMEARIQRDFYAFAHNRWQRQCVSRLYVCLSIR